MGKARVKSYTMAYVGDIQGNIKCYVHCYPQQMWDYSILDNKVQLTHRNIDMIISKETFDKMWKVVE